MILQEDRPSWQSEFGRADAGNVFLNRVLSDGEAEFEQFATKPFGPPPAILLWHQLDQSDGLRGKVGTAATVARFEFPEETESLTMPAQESVGLDQQGVLAENPIRHRFA